MLKLISIINFELFNQWKENLTLIFLHISIFPTLALAWYKEQD